MKLAIVMLSTDDAESIRSILRFSIPIPNVEYMLIYKAGVLNPECPIFSCYSTIQVPDDHSYISSVSDILREHEFNYVVFATRASMDYWYQHTGKACVRLWQGNKLNLAHITEEHKPIFESNFMGRSRYSALISEAELSSIPSNRISTSYLTLGDYLKRNVADEILLTTNGDLIDALILADPAAYILYHLCDNEVHVCLELTTGSSSYYNKFHVLNSFAAGLGESDSTSSFTYQSIRDAWKRSGQSYSFFAEFYDQYMSHVDYNLWLGMVLAWVKRFSKNKPERILELACGTANISEALVALGFEVDACDSSPFMLHMADAKLFKPKLWRQSMADKLPEACQYDLVLCLFDSINYLQTKTEIKAMLSNVYQATTPGGMFVFDISTLMNSRENFNDTTQFHLVQGGYLIHQAQYDSLANRQRSTLTLFRKNTVGYSKQVETHSQRVYRSQEMLDLIATSGFTIKGIFSPESRYNLIGKTSVDIDRYYARLFFVLVKP